MIGSITGKIIEKYNGSFLVDVAGVGYEVTVPAQVFETFKVQDDVKLRTHLHVREDALVLFGFEKLEQLKLFQLLIGVSGVGPKMALSIVSAYSVEEITEAVSKASPELFQSISGIGKKNAQRIIVDLQSKF